MCGKILIKGGRIVTAVDDFIGDILIMDGTISAVGADLSDLGADAAVRDAAGLMVLPGGVDVHCHLDYDTGTAHTCDTFETGGQAAAFGGTTTLVDYAHQHVGESPLAAFEDWRRRAECATVDVGAHMILTDASAPMIADARQLIRNEGVTSLKVFTAYPGALMLDDGGVFETMRVAASESGMVCVHAENGAAIDVLVREAVAAGHTAPRYHARTRPTITEGEATHRVICLAEMAGTPVYIVHVSAGEAVAAITAARDRGLPVFGETCPHYLFLTDAVYETPDFAEGAKAVMTPPLRGLEHQKALWRGLRSRDLQVIATDHCPFCASRETMGEKYSKQREPECFKTVPNGAPGLENRMPLLFDAAVAKNRLSLNRLVELCATAPAKIFGLFPQKGTIAPGSDADLVLYDPAARTTVRAADQHGNIDYTLFEGFELTGAVRQVYLRGELIVDGNRWLGRAGQGRYLPRSASGTAAAL